MIKTTIEDLGNAICILKTSCQTGDCNGKELDRCYLTKCFCIKTEPAPFGDTVINLDFGNKVHSITFSEVEGYDTVTDFTSYLASLIDCGSGGEGSGGGGVVVIGSGSGAGSGAFSFEGETGDSFWACKKGATPEEDEQVLITNLIDISTGNIIMVDVDGNVISVEDFKENYCKDCREIEVEANKYEDQICAVEGDVKIDLAYLQNKWSDLTQENIYGVNIFLHKRKTVCENNFLTTNASYEWINNGGDGSVTGTASQPFGTIGNDFCVLVEQGSAITLEVFFNL